MELDPVAALLLDEAGPPSEGGRILVIDEPALASHLHDQDVDVLAYCDDLRDERDLSGPGLAVLDQSTLAGVELVLLRLPKSLGMLQDYAERIASWASPTVKLLAGGREKHLSRGMNEVLAKSFRAVHASRGRQKSRVLHASGASAGARTWPREAVLDEIGLTVVSHGGVFAAGKLDGGTRLLLKALHDGRLGGAEAGRAVDLGCGSGVLACRLAALGYDTHALDVSRAAVDSARDTAARNSLSVTVERKDGLAGATPTSVDLVVCNPPFHRGTTKDSTPGFDLLASAVPALAPGAEVLTVFNSHLPYLQFLRERIGSTKVVARDRLYTVTRSRLAAGDARRGDEAFG